MKSGYGMSPQVLWLGREQCSMTWEPASNVPTEIIREYEKGMISKVTDTVSSTGIGQTVHTLSVTASQSCQNSTTVRPVVKESDG